MNGQSAIDINFFDVGKVVIRGSLVHLACAHVNIFPHDAFQMTPRTLIEIARDNQCNLIPFGDVDGVIDVARLVMAHNEKIAYVFIVQSTYDSSDSVVCMHSLHGQSIDGPQAADVTLPLLCTSKTGFILSHTA